MKHYIRVTSGPYRGTIYEFAAKRDALALARELEKLRPHSTDYGNDRDGFPETHLKGRPATTRAHATTRHRRSAKLTWKREPGTPGIQAPISHGGDAHHYVISHRTDLHTVSYRPPGQHHHVGSYKTEREAKAAAAQHAETGTAPPSTDRWSVAAWGPQGRPR